MQKLQVALLALTVFTASTMGSCRIQGDWAVCPTQFCCVSDGDTHFSCRGYSADAGKPGAPVAYRDGSKQQSFVLRVTNNATQA
ncbi:hypothetical protein AAVH_41291 [Aphelenchoides avenae]|nr:hypothetical protein AAVH_41291 [Aphelenchus avenae]